MYHPPLPLSLITITITTTITATTIAAAPPRPFHSQATSTSPASEKSGIPAAGEQPERGRHSSSHAAGGQPFLHRSSTGPDVQQVVIRRLVTPLHRKGIDEPLEAFAELAVLTEDQRLDAADLL